MTRGNLGIAGQIQLAQAAALPPFAQMMADPGGPGCCGGRCWLCVHGKKLTREFRSFHDLTGNRFGSAAPSWSGHPQRPTEGQRP
jgi:hypothetical protein